MQGAEAATLHVPADHATIQQAIDAAVDGDAVLVAPGTYQENLDFRGKAIALLSEQGARDTIIDGRRLGSVLLFDSAETTATMVSGFTIRNGQASFGSGVYALNSSPTLVDNIFEANQYESIMGFNSSMVLQRNLFRDHTSCSVVEFVNSSSPSIKDNAFANNRCVALDIGLPVGNQPDVANNTFVNNDVGLHIDARVPTSTHLYRNNLFYGNGIGVRVEFGSAPNYPTLSNNLFFGNSTPYTGFPNPIGTAGNIAADPKLGGISADDYHPDTGSAAIDAGDDVAVDAGETDFHGDTRIRDGGSGVARVDIGAGEYISAPPVVTLTSDVTSIALGQSVKFNWSTTNATSCTARGAWSGARALSGSQTVTPAASGVQTFKVVCSNSAASRAGVVTVVVYPAPTIAMSLSATSVQEGFTSYLTWSTTTATACTAGGSWNGAQATAGSFAVGPPAPGSYTYSLSCTGPGGAASASVQLTVIAKPKLTFTLDLENIAVGALATLTWSAVDATSCDASGSWSGTKSVSGTQSVGPFPPGSYGYSLACQGPGGWTQLTRTLVVYPAPTVTVAVVPAGVLIGATASVRWSSVAATVCTASGAWAGTLPPAGSQDVTPQSSGTQSFVLTCTGPGGTGQASAALNVFPLPTLTISLSPPTIFATDPATLTWSSTDASTCSAANAWGGPVAVSGTQAVTQSSAGTYVYEITCTGSGGTVTKATTLTVNAKPAPPVVDSGGGGGALSWFEISFMTLFTGLSLYARRARVSIAPSANLRQASTQNRRWSRQTSPCLALQRLARGVVTGQRSED